MFSSDVSDTFIVPSSWESSDEVYVGILVQFLKFIGRIRGGWNFWLNSDGIFGGISGYLFARIAA